MTIQVNIGEAKTRLSELVAASIRGEEVVLAKAGAPQARIVPFAELAREELERRIAQRRSALGMYSHLTGGRSIDIRDFKPTEAELDERERRKFGAPD